MALFCVNPDYAREDTRCQEQLSPVFPTFSVSFVGARRSKGKRETDDEPKDRQKHRIYCKFDHKLRYASDQSGPPPYQQKRKDHFGGNAALQAEEEGPF